MKIIFLDVDGVLNSLQYYESFEANAAADENLRKAPLDPEAVRRLRRIVDAAGPKDTALVLTSSWRGGWSPDPARCGSDGRALDRALGAEGLVLLDKTPALGLGARPEEVRAWLAQWPGPVESFVILDDACFEWERCHLQRYWVQTDFQFGGLKEEHIAQAKYILKRRPAELRRRNRKLAKSQKAAKN